MHVLIALRSRWKMLVFLFAVGLSAMLYFQWQLNLEDPQGGSNPWCDDFDEGSISNGNGMVISMHTTACTTLGTDVGTYVHIHREHEARSRKSLAFRFSPNYPSVPKLEWINPTSVRISVDHVSQITKQSRYINGISVEYLIGAEDYPPELEAAKERGSSGGKK